MVGGEGDGVGGGRARFQALISDLLRGQEENTEDGGVGEGLEKRDQVLSPPPLLLPASSSWLLGC